MQGWTREAAADDVAAFGKMAADQRLKVVFDYDRGAGTPALKLFARGAPVPLQRCIEVLDCFGLPLTDYQAVELGQAAGGQGWVQYFVPEPGQIGELDRQRVEQLEFALQETLEGRAERDHFSRLVLTMGLSLPETMLLRACARYLRQIGCTVGQDYLAEVLARHPQPTRALVAWFHARFRPGLADRAAAESAAAAELESALAKLRQNDDQRVLMSFKGLIAALLRTNFYQKDAAGGPKDYLALKFDCAAVEGLPAPRPLYEVFVYSARMEGIHLRGGKVARGGLRWSDRLHDFRTEVHGLFKAQMVKNVVIVPEGAKGGFVVKRPPQAEGEALRREAVACYSTLIRGLLDITDNLAAGAIVPPPEVVRRDDDDPYLVVAADKGTATFSDIANGIAGEYGFWLGDAFASGGSAGYDHKKLGITARGAWEAVKRHFRELGVDAASDPIEVVGVGDMSGDVFGNGLLLSPQMRLLGAFDHRHIFVDPLPDTAGAYAERQRLFALPASSWADFDPAALGTGGAVYSRADKEINLSRQAQERFGLPAKTTPRELMRALLAARIDLLWLGGIGTYVRSAEESDAAVGDRANDAIRIEGRALGCRVVGEGANLGLTQRGRVEAAQHGVRLNTDAIDNAGGVSCSDHEVNIKILLDAAEKAGSLPREARNPLLAAMADEVCNLVLADVRLQTQALSIAEARAGKDLDRHLRLMSFFEERGQLDRDVAGLPDDATLLSRRAQGQGLTRPELAVLLAHTKIALFGEFISSSLPDDPLLERDLLAYFPRPLGEGFRDELLAHPLRREIVTTAVVNSMVNRVGSGFVNDIQEQTGAGDADVARAYLVARELFSLEECWRHIETLDTACSSASHLALLLASREIAELATLWILRNHSFPIDISAAVAALGSGLDCGLAALASRREGRLAGERRHYCRQLAEVGAPSELAERMATLWSAAANLDLLAVAARGPLGVDEILDLAEAVDDGLGVSRLKESLFSVPCRNPAEASALACLVDAVSAIPVRIMACHGADRTAAAAPKAWLDRFLAGRQAAVSLYESRRRALCQHHPDLAGALLATAALRELVARP